MGAVVHAASEFAQFCGAGRTSGTPPTALGVSNSWPASAPGRTALDGPVLKLDGNTTA